MDERYIRSRIPRHKILSWEEEVVLGKKALKGDEEAIQSLVDHNLRLVLHIAKKFTSNRLTLGDCLNTGVEGLYKAARKFDPSKEVRFATYATWWIRETLLKARWNQQSGFIRLPQEVMSIDKKFREGQDMTEKEDNEFEKSCRVREGYASVYNLPDEASPKASEAEDTLSDPENLSLLQPALKRLKAQDRAIICARFGLPPHDKAMTYREIESFFCINKEISRIRCKEALEKLRAVFVELRDEASR